MTTTAVDLTVPYEHSEWRQPLFETLIRRVSFAPFDLTRAAFHNDEAPCEVAERRASGERPWRGRAQELTGALVRRQQRLDLVPERGIALRVFVEKGSPLLLRARVNGGFCEGRLRD